MWLLKTVVEVTNLLEHMDSHLLEVLNLNGDFELLLENPVIQGRVDYLTKYLKGASDNSNENYTLSLTLFSLFIENVSLFSQFAIIKAFNKHKNVLKDIDNVVQATQKEETIHALLGGYIINQVKKEYPEWFNEEFYEKLYRACRKAYDAEVKIIDWIFEKGELEFLPKECLHEFIKSRFNESIIMIGGEKVFDIDQDKLQNLQWFIEELHADVNIDFFNKKSTMYSKKTQSITSEDLF
jgi:ribonucleoside-diphosphate reductase beta chain